MSLLDGLAQLPAELLLIWHDHRVPILFSAIALAAIVRLAIYARGRRDKVSASPLPGTPIEKKKIELRPEWLPENTTFNASALNVDGHAEDDTGAVATVAKIKKGPKTVKGKKTPKKTGVPAPSFNHTTDKIQPVVFFQSLSGTTERYAKEFAKVLTEWTTGCDQASSFLELQLHDISYIEYDDFFISPPKVDANVKQFYIILLPTYNIDTVLDNFLENLQETHNDFRIDTAPLRSLLGYSVFGFGDKEGWPTEEEGFCSQSREVDKWMARLTGRKRAYPLGMGDTKTDAADRLQEWRLGVQEALVEIAEGRGLGEGVVGSGDPAESDEEEDIEDGTGQSTRVDEIEELGSMVDSSSTPIPVDFTTYKSKSKPLVKSSAAPKEMVPTTSPTHAALTKQGYSIIGSHSGVKICRWTKSALRGRGSCYKYSFYGIASHLCMEATPSLSCSNKCVFCWRHGTNPVGTTWRWITDAPDLIFDGITAAHYKKIKMMKGVPGVRAERFAEAMRIRHCALSLVGEPIFYPHINELLEIMHSNRISTFLVCNAQHPAQLASLVPVTQLYVSIDASNKESLRKIDRPLHRDFWERFCACLDILRNRRFEQRTVFRLTLVKGFNMAEEVRGYADLVERALPGFVEVKGVTYCGTSAAGDAGLTMQNVPFYEEVAEFVTELEKELSSRGLTYGIGAEHAHSCCVLLADRTRFMPNGKWATRIDFERFFDLYEGKVEGTRVEGGKVVGWRPEDYVGDETPEWALWGNGGFDPRDQRVYRKGKGPKNDEEGEGGKVLEIKAKNEALEF
ncbi:tRNA 4-demethylwyosine synthase [Parastagonospora nodorum]|nr:tRNA 4-demethylwyosine synthase [Parastagonospora nodorum]KAH4672177.1 tRNA 4-demethylwyosine synthase [Parastagonospora nodorum]KAH4696847.1 tRNA 4-demethylwyosine synthase [Parastagonospora nodorum]KAH4764380.1 tRNA 4-demethylwyosine synthase [Parastagonospora nodorum]KAH4773655.1 tRNA 4-demethylwyosine synthase [Parastagonospora nodorum]